jgi:ABC-2 type transport system ATP-binding protein
MVGRMRLSAVGYRYGWRAPWVLERVDLDLQAGDLVRIGGYNGSGKSTLMRIIAGVHLPLRGTVADRPARTAYVPGQLPPLPFKAHDYLRHCGRVQGLSGEEADQRILGWLERFEALGYRKHRIGDLSRGTAQKVAIVQAMIGEPDLLILDEAWTSLDASGQETLDEVARATAKRGGRVVYVDHNPQRLSDDAKGAYMLRDGILAQASAVDFEIPMVVVDLENAPDPWPGPAQGRVLADGTLRIEVQTELSDRLLREILANHPRVHILSVRTVDARATQAGREGQAGKPPQQRRPDQQQADAAGARPRGPVRQP